MKVWLIILFILYSIALLLIGRFVLQPEIDIQPSDQITQKYEDTLKTLRDDAESLKADIAILKDSLDNIEPYTASIEEIDHIVKEDSTQSVRIYREWMQTLGAQGIQLSLKPLTVPEIVQASKYFVELYYLRQNYSTLAMVSEKQDNLILNLEAQLAVKDSMINELSINLDTSVFQNQTTWLEDIWNFIDSFPVGYALGLATAYFLYKRFNN